MASLLRRFNPYQLSDEVVDALATGRDDAIAHLLAEVDKNRSRRPVQHVLLNAPRGFGKSFLLRMLQNALRDRANVGFALLPEEQPNIRAPALFLREIQRVFEGRPAADVTIRRDLGPSAWEEAVVALDASISERLGPNGLLVATVENFDDLMADAFVSDESSRRLRGLLARDDGRLMLIVSCTRAVDDDPERPLFEAFTPIGLRLWRDDDVLAFFDRIRQEMNEAPLSNPDRARARAIAVFAGGSPRIATILYDVLTERNADTAAGALETLVDELSDYYRERVRRLSPRARDVLDTLLRHGEPKSQTEIATLLGYEGQARVAEPFRELLTSQVLTGARSVQSAEGLYQVTDRLFAYFYRSRYFDPDGKLPRLERIADFLADFFTPEEQREEAEKLRAVGRIEDAAVFDRLLAARAARVEGPKSEGERPAGSAEDRLENAQAELRMARERNDEAAEIFALIDLGYAEGDLADHATAIATLRQAAALAEALGNRGGQAKSLRHIGWSQGEMGEHAAAIATLRQAVALAEAVGDRRERAESLRDIGWSQGQMGEHAAAIATLRQVAALAEALGDRGGQAVSLRHIGWNQGQMGEHAAAIATLRQAVALAEAVGDRREQAESLRHIGWNQGQMGEHADAIATLRQAVALAEAVGDRPEQAESLRRIGWSQGEMGEHAAAIATLRQAVALAEALGDRRKQADSLRLIGWSQGQMGEHAAAIATFQEAVAVARAAGDQTTISQALVGIAFETVIIRLKGGSITDSNALLQLVLNGPPLGDTAHFLPTAAAASFAVFGLRSGTFPRTWRLIGEHPSVLAAADPSETASVLAKEIASRLKRDGRAAAYGDAAEIVTTLAADLDRPMPSRFNASSLLRATVDRLCREVMDPSLLRDIADLLDARVANAMATEIALLRARAIDLEHPDDPAALERVEPDIVAAVRRMRGVTDPEALFRRGKGNGTEKKRKRKVRS